jgi:hypothetical protein
MTLVDDEGVEYHLLCIPDLVQAKKTQRSKDWPVIELLVTIHYRQHASEATDEQVDFWLHEARTPELLAGPVTGFPARIRCRPHGGPAASARPATAAIWPRLPPTSPITSSRRCRCGSG